MINICYIDEDGRFGGPQQRMLLVTSALKKLSKKINIFYLIPNNKEVLYFEDKLKKNNFFIKKKI